MWRTIRDVRVLGIFGILLFASVIQILNVTVYSAEATVSRYLTAMEQGRLADAAAIAMPDTPASRLVPLSADATKRPHDAVITGSSTANGVTTVRATALLGDDTVPITFTLRPGSSWSPLRTWEFVQLPVAVVDVTSATQGLASLNGQAVSTSRRVLVPQMVSVGSATDWFTTTPLSVVVTKAGTVNSATVEFTPTKKLTSLMDEAVHSYLDDCAVSTSLVPEKCPFAAFTFDAISAGPTWAIDTYPTLSITSGDSGWSVTGSGTVNLSVSLVDFATEATTAYTETLPFTIAGTISGLDTATPKFTVTNTVER